MTEKIELKRMNLNEFMEEGFLLEANRNFFHPLGLALEVYIDQETKDVTGMGVQDWRDDPEGVWFFEFTESDKKKIKNVESLRKSKEKARIKVLGLVVQPVKK